jgi:hypothetical protein
MSHGMTDFQMQLNEYNQMENIAKLAEYYGAPDMPITDFTSVEAFHAYLAQYQPNVNTNGFIIVRMSLVPILMKFGTTQKSNS